MLHGQKFLEGIRFTLLFLLFFIFSVNSSHAADPETLSSTSEFNLTDPFLVTKATELNNDPVKIYEFVRDEISFEAYEGSLRGARGTLWSKAGNSLDQASLLIALLRISGIPARYAQGTLAQDKAKILIGSMFDLPLRILGCPATDIPRSDPVNDPLLLNKALQHYWVEFDDGSGFKNFDPSFSNAQIGESFTNIGKNFNTVKAELQHKVTIRLVVEEKGNAFSPAPTQKNVMSLSFASASLAGKPLTIGHFVDTKSISGLVSGTVTHTYSPYLLIGENDSNINDDELIRGDDYQEFASSFLPFVNQIILGVFVEIDIISPDLTIETHRRSLLDRVGFATRHSSNTTTLLLDGLDIQEPALNQLDSITIYTPSGLQEANEFKRLGSRLKPNNDKFAQLAPLLEQIPQTGNATKEQSEIIGKAIPIASNILTIGNELITQFFAVIADKNLKELSQIYMVKAYYDSPRIIISRSTNGESGVNINLDIRKNSLKIIPFPNQVLSQSYNFEIARGLAESSIEGEVVAQITQSTKPVLTTVNLFNNLPADTDVVFINNKSLEKLDSLDLSEEAIARINVALSRGKSVFVPNKRIDWEGQSAIAWLEVDSSTGELIGVGEDGNHVAALEYSFFFAKGTTDLAARSFTALTGVPQDGGVLRLTAFSASALAFLGGFFEGLNEGQSTKQAIQNGRGEIPRIERILNDSCLALAGLGFIGSVFASGPIGPTPFPDAESSFTECLDVKKGSSEFQALIPTIEDPPLPLVLFSPQVPELPDLTASSFSQIVHLMRPDRIFTQSTLTGELASNYRYYIHNNGVTEETYHLNFNTPSTNYTISSSVSDITIPAGKTAEIGVCLKPTGTFDVPDTEISFDVSTSRDSDPNTIETINTVFVTPKVVNISLVSSTLPLNLLPGESGTLSLEITSNGNTATGSIPLSLRVDPGLEVTGLPASISLDAGQTKVVDLTVLSTDNTSSSSALSFTISTKFGSDLDGNPYETSVVTPINVTTPEIISVLSCSQALSSNTSSQLAQVVFSIADDLAKIQEPDFDKRVCNRLAHKYHNLAQLAAVNPGWSDKLTEIQRLRDDANACKVDQLVPDSQTFFTDNCFVQGGSSSTSSVSILPSNIELKPDSGVVTELIVELKNNTKKDITYDLSLGSLPNKVSASLNQQTVTIKAGETLDANSANPIKISLQHTIDTVKTFPVSIIVSPQGEPNNKLTDSSLISIRLSLVDILKVSPTPAVLADNQTSIDVSIQVLNTANKSRSVLAKLEIIDTNGDVVGADIPTFTIDLPATTEAITLNLGTVSVAALTKGEYYLRATLQTLSGQSLPGRSAEALLYKGAVVSAEASNDPIVVTPGDSTVNTSIKITNLAALSGISGSREKAIEYHTANAVVESLSDMNLFVGDANAIIGLPKEDNFVSLNGGTIVIDLGEDGNLATNGPADDFMILLKTLNNYDVEVGIDTNNFVPLGSGQGTTLFDLEGTSLTEIRYIKIIDKSGTLTGQEPGADILGVRVLNAKKGIHVERVNFSLGREGYSAKFYPVGIEMTPVIGNIDDDPTPEIIVITDSHVGSSGSRLVVIDGLTGNEQFNVEAGVLTVSPAIAELKGDISGAEIVINGRADGSLALLSSSGVELWSEMGGAVNSSKESGAVSPVIANIDNDPTPEIITTGGSTNEKIVVRDVNGVEKWSVLVNTNASSEPSSIIAADIDGDGISEIVSTTKNGSIVAVKGPTNSTTPKQGNILWETHFISGSTETWGGPAIADLDGRLGGDTNPEIIVGSHGSRGILNILNHDGSYLKQIVLGNEVGLISPPSIADINSDGIADIIFSDGKSDKVFAISLNAEVLSRAETEIPLTDVLIWSAPAPDTTSSGSGISVYDLDGDGIWEVILNIYGNGSTNGGLSIFSGSDGKLLYNNPRINSLSYDENVVIADIDGDGHTELIAVDQEGLWIIGADDLWVSARDIWNQQSYHITNINSDLTVPAKEIPSWSDHNTYRTQRPPDSVINLLDIKVEHLINDPAFALDESKTTPATESQNSSKINWSFDRRFSDPATVVLNLSGLVENMTSGEVRQISDGTAITVSFAAEPVAGKAVDLTNWVANGPGNWVVQTGNDTVLQTRNSNPSIFYSSRDSQGLQLSGKITVQASGNWDDDFIGFVLGYHEGDFNNEDVDYLLIDWKQGNQSGAKRGLSISHITKSVSSTNGADPLTNGAWLHDPLKGVTELQRGVNLGDMGWKDETTYSFDITFTSTLVEVFVDGNKEISITGVFNNGAFGFYNNSQSHVLYSAISEATIPDPTTTTINLPPLVVAAKQLLSLAPDERTITAGDTATYVLIVNNPLDTEQTFGLSLVGLDSATTDLPSSITIPAESKQEITLTVSATDDLLESYNFSIEAVLASGNSSSVEGKLIVNETPIVVIPKVDLGTLAIDLQLSPTQVVAGQGTSAKYRVRLTNTGSETTVYKLTGKFPQGISANFARTEITLLPGLSNFQFVDLTLTPDIGTNSGNYAFEVTATASTDKGISAKQTAQLAVSNVGVQVDLVPKNSSFVLHVSNTGDTTETYALSLTDSLALYATLAKNEVTLAAGKTETVSISLLPVRLALPGTLPLTAIATAKSNNAINDHDSESFNILLKRAVMASFSPAEQSVKVGDKTRFTLLVRNTGNKEDSYKAVIISKSGATADLIDLDGSSPTQSIAQFRLPAFSTGVISLDAVLADAIKRGEVVVDVISLTDSNIKARTSAILNSLVNENDEDQDGIFDVNEFGGDPHLDQDGDNIPIYLDDNDNDVTIGDADKRVSAGFDSDGDGIANFLDIDDDNDRILTRDEGGTKDTDSDGIPDYLESNARDTDGDHISDFRDDDDDGDGLSTLQESNGDINKAGDRDGDHIPDYMDADDSVSNDSDNDGLSDLVECPTAPACIDHDGDDIPDYMDADSDGDGESDAEEIGSDPDNPLDSDADSIPDYLESSRVDLDGDGKSDQQDNDDDGDGVLTKAEATQDVDKDGILDYLDLSTDTDNDSDKNGIPDYKECPAPIDGCPDRDGDMIPDYLDNDDDGDAKLDTAEIGNNPKSPLDRDADGIPDYLEADHRDTDGDGKPDPDDADDDGDGTATKDETIIAAPGRFLDSDHDNIPDYLDPDTTQANPEGDPEGDGDEDGVLDSHEHPYRGLGPDTDVDGIPNYMDTDDDNDGLLTLKETEYPDDDKDGIPNYLERNDIDTDGDGLKNYVDPDDDNDGIPTSIERGKDFFHPDKARLEGNLPTVHTAIEGGAGSFQTTLLLYMILLVFLRFSIKTIIREEVR